MKEQTNASAGKDKPQKRKGPKKPRKVTESYLRNSGMFYLQRFPASSGHFRTVMMRKVRKSCAFHKDQDIESCTKMVESLVQDFISEGLLDDESYLRGMVTSLRRQGKSRQAIMAKLKQKQMPDHAITQTLENFDEENFDDPYEAEFLSALKIARKKRLGPFDRKQKYEFEKALNALARQGFGFDTARRVLELKSEDIERDYPEYQVFLS